MAFLKRCAAALKPGGKIFVKENVCDIGFLVDNDDASLTRYVTVPQFGLLAMIVYSNDDMYGNDTVIFGTATGRMNITQSYSLNWQNCG